VTAKNLKVVKVDSDENLAARAGFGARAERQYIFISRAQKAAKKAK